MPSHRPDATHLADHSPSTSRRPHLGARLEDRYHRVLSRLLRSRDWRPAVLPYTGYGSAGTTSQPGSVRVMARVLLTRPRREDGRPAGERRGYRSFFSAPAPGERVDVQIAGRSVALHADRGGYLHATVDADLEPGRHEVTYRVATGECVTGDVVVVAPGERLGVVSDIDDTVLVTALPRPLVAAWNTFARHPSARHTVPGMAGLYRGIQAAHPDAPFVYLSTGAWNTAATLRRFLQTHGFPAGPLLLTDWGPTNTGWFRSGPEHKNAELDRLVQEFPDVRWLLIGDDGQHDPEIYARAARLYPDHVAGIAIRELTPGQQLLAHGTPTALRQTHAEVVSAPDGRGLAVKLAAYLRPAPPG
ncbi:App1 family protein [Paraoerskovia marina]|uniref:App1 family protein n=1 Tax=Paraoerskovia marina TaxID=545619 RepID=UPI0006941B5D|nr:phosphatase domain-containing protein [Paraoerskovia marina]